MLHRSLVMEGETHEANDELQDDVLKVSCVDHFDCRNAQAYYVFRLSGTNVKLFVM